MERVAVVRHRAGWGDFWGLEGIGHRESVRHATLKARAERDPGGFGRIMSNLATPAGA